MTARRTVRLLFPALALAALTAHAQWPGGPQPPPKVTVTPVEARTVPVTLDYVGVTAASKVVEIRARVQGFIDTREFEEGSLVKQGQRLYTIDPRSFKADQEIAQAQVEQAESRLRLAQQDVKRLQSVTEPGAVAATDLDQKRAEEADAAAALRLAKARLAKADLELSYTTIETPLTGLIGKVQKDIGSLVDASQNSLLTTLQVVDPIYVSYKMAESELLQWRRDLAAGTVRMADGEKAPYLTVTLADGTEYDERGVIDFENVEADVTTGTVEMRGTFPNPGRLLKPGQYVKVNVMGMARPNTVTVPQRVVSQSPQGAFVFVVGADNKAELRGVKLGQWVGQDWVVLEGLKPGEQLIVDGLTMVQPGITVAPVAATGEAPPTSATAPAPPGAAPARGE